MSTPESVTITLPNGALAGWPTLIDALRRAEVATDLHMVFGGLIEQIERQTNPKPAEPMGLGAVVEDAEGVCWVRWSRVNSSSIAPWRWERNRAQGGGALHAHYASIPAVRVLSDGVSS